VTFYRIKKCFQGGEGIYYARMPKGFRIKHHTKRYGNYWKTQLEEWGEHTNGGHNYGYRIYVTWIKALPKKKKEILKFNKLYLERIRP
jgi:hypothetical protein